MMTMFWSGEKARKKSLFLILGYFVWGFRLSQATVLMKSNGNFFNKFVYSKFLRKKKVNELMMQSLPSQLETKS